MTYLMAGLIGLVSGITSGLFGVGGGIIMVPAMMYFLKMDIKMAIGTSLAVMVPTVMVGALQHIRHGHLANLDWRVPFALVPLAIGGGWLGAWLTTQIQAANLKRAFGAFLVIVGLRIFFR
jgi:uncharacterized protein